MPVLISIVFLVLVSSIYGDFTTTPLDLKITGINNSVTFSTADPVSKHENIVDIHNQSKSIVSMDMKRTANDSAANQSPMAINSAVGTDNTTVGLDLTNDYSQMTATTTTTESSTAFIILQTGDCFSSSFSRENTLIVFFC